MVIANLLLALGMHMLSPTTVSLPFKLLLFVLADGWHAGDPRPGRELRMSRLGDDAGPERDPRGAAAGAAAVGAAADRQHGDRASWSALFQAATQIQDQTLAFVPKLVVVMVVLVAMGPVLGASLVRFTQAMLLAIPSLR